MARRVGGLFLRFGSRRDALGFTQVGFHPAAIFAEFVLLLLRKVFAASRQRSPPDKSRNSTRYLPPSKLIGEFLAHVGDDLQDIGMVRVS